MSNAHSRPVEETLEAPQEYVTALPPASDLVEDLRKELIDFQKCVKGNLFRLDALCDIGVIDGHDLEPDLCVPLMPFVARAIGREAVAMIMGGMTVDGTDGNWSCGFLGSRWFDMDAKDYGCAFIRCAFYSKKHFAGAWPSDKPYMLRITAEKTEE
jgi:hypothetical protein